VDVARIGIPRPLSAPRQAHFIAADLEVVGVEKLAGVAADHFLRLVPENGLRARAHLNQDGPGIDHQDQILGSVEDAASLLDLLAQGVLGSAACGDVAGSGGCTDDGSRRGLDRGNGERNLDQAAISAQALGFIVLDRFPPADPAQDVTDLFGPIGRRDEVDALAHRFRRGIAEQAFRGRIPAGDGAVEGFGDDGVNGRFNGGAENALARGVMVARGFGVAMLLNLVFERGGLCIRFAHHPGKCAREHAGLAARIDWNRNRSIAAGTLDGRRQLKDRPGQRPRNEHGQRGRAQHGDQSDQQG